MPANITDKCSSNTINSVYEPLLWKDCLTKALCFLASSKVRGLKSCCHMVVYISVTRNLVIVQLRERLALLKVSQKEIEEKKRDEILEAKQVLLQHTGAFLLKQKKKRKLVDTFHKTFSFFILLFSNKKLWKRTSLYH